MIISERRAVVVALGAFSVAATAMHANAAPGDAVHLAPHRAVYDFVLARSGSSSVTDVTGRMVYELTGATCEGFNQSMRFVTRMVSQDGSASVTDLRSTSFEDGAAKTLKFNSDHYREEKLSETTVGEATRSGSETKVEIAKPAQKSMSISPDVLFPVQHTIRMIEVARRNETVLQADLYDGSDKGEKVYTTTAMIGRAKAAGYNKTLTKIENADKLDPVRAWPVSLSYFEPGQGSGDAVPSYELSFVFFENGVVRQMTLDYGDFALKGDLKSITFLDEPKCAAKR